jgi:hypothetical protein
MTTSLDTPPELTSNQPFVAPDVSIGDMVKWFFPGNEDACSIGFVQRVSLDGMLAISLIPYNAGNPRYGNIDNFNVAVMHKDDPRQQYDHFGRRYGAWDLTDKEKLLRALLSRVEKLERKKSEK